MLGYCSNSPLRCEKAHSMEILNSVDSYCPECHLFLLPAQVASRQLRADEQFLRFTILKIISMLLALVYLYYSNFV